MTQKHPSTYVLMDANDNPWGSFDSAQTAAQWAVKKWPDQKEGREIGEGWIVWALRHPDT